MINIYNNIEKYNAKKEYKILTVLLDMITDMLSNEKLNLILTELFTRGRKLKIYLLSGHYFIMTSSNKQELQQIAFNHLSDIDFKDFMNLCQKILPNHIFLVIDAALKNLSSFWTLFYYDKFKQTRTSTNRI